MAKTRLHLKTRDEFAALSLHGKNDYLQGVAQQIAHVRAEEFSPLDKDSLSRIRRYYSRRSFADLRLEQLTDEFSPPIAHPARRSHPGGGGRKSHRPRASDPRGQGACSAAAAGRRPAFVLRPEHPRRAHQGRLQPHGYRAFRLVEDDGEGVIRYELKDSIITVEGGAQVGLATAYDYDIVISMISHLADATRRYRIDNSKGLRPTLPPRVYRPAASEILKFCRRELGGKQYEDLERALDRLQATRIKITNLTTARDTAKSKRREVESFPLIGRYKVVTRTTMERIDQVEIEIPNWVYEGVVKPDGKPSILTLNPDYFLITRPIAKFLYRLARKAAGQTEARYGLAELHKRSGSKLPPHKFRHAIQEIVEAAVPLPDYDLSLVKGEGGPVLRMVNRAYDKNRVLQSASA